MLPHVTFLPPKITRGVRSCRECPIFILFSDTVCHGASRAIVPAGRISPFFLAHRKPQSSFPVAFVCFFGSRKVWLFVVRRVRLLVKPTFWRSACVTGRRSVRLICWGGSGQLHPFQHGKRKEPEHSPDLHSFRQWDEVRPDTAPRQCHPGHRS